MQNEPNIPHYGFAHLLCDASTTHHRRHDAIYGLRHDQLHRLSSCMYLYNTRCDALNLLLVHRRPPDARRWSCRHSPYYLDMPGPPLPHPPLVLPLSLIGYEHCWVLVLSGTRAARTMGYHRYLAILYCSRAILLVTFTALFIGD